MKPLMFLRVIIHFCLLLLTLQLASAETVYRWVDSTGRTHFGTKPPAGSAASPANLPKVSRENLDEKIQKIKAKTPKNCVNHGGLDCSSGPDADGSVICLDGYREAILPFRFGCLETRLTINKAQLLLTSASEEQTPVRINEIPNIEFLKPSMTTFAVTVRNASDVLAKNVAVKLQVSRLKQFEIPGPTEIEPFGIAEYTLPLNALAGGLSMQELKKLSAIVRCENCTAPAQQRF